MILSRVYGKWRWAISQFAEKRWWSSYLKGKDQIEYLKWKRSYWKDFLQIVNIDIPQKSQILDAGCGPSGIFIILEHNQVIAIDSLLNDYVAKKYLDIKHYPHTEFINTSVEDFKSFKSFDYIFCINAINHVRDIGKSLRTLANNLKDDGILIISTDAHKNDFLKKIFQILPGDILHPQQYSTTDYEYMLEKENFKIRKKIVLKSGTIFDYCVFIAGKKSDN